MIEKSNGMVPRISCVNIFAVGLLFASSLTQAGDSSSPQWANALKNMGTVYSSEDNPAVQSVKLFGRAHGQWNYSDGDSAGEDFNGSGEELRRLRGGASVSFLNGFKALGRMNLEQGGFGSTELGFESWDELYIEYSSNKTSGFDSASIGYGRYKLLFGGEEHQSSKRIKTIERSAINNRFGSRRPTGVVMNANKVGVEYILGLWSRKPDPKGWAGWSEGVAVQASATFESLGGEWILDFVYADDADASETVFDYDWASSVTYNRDFERGSLLTNATLSRAGDVDPLGIVILPTYDLVQDRLELAFRYQWAHSSAKAGVPRSSSSRGIRRVTRKEGLSTGNGDNYHALYAGLNYYIAGDSVKIMSGLEYETIRGESESELDGFTFWLAARIYF